MYVAAPISSERGLILTSWPSQEVGRALMSLSEFRCPDGFPMVMQRL